MAGKNSVNIHFLQFNAAVGNRPKWDDLKIAYLVFGLLTAVWFNQTDHDIHALLALQVGIAEHMVGFADAGGRSDIDSKASGLLLAFQMKLGHCLAHLDGVRNSGCNCDRERKPERCALTQAALDCDLAAEGLYQAADKREPHARATL